MQIITHTTGKATGRICIIRTIETMQIGEVWIADPSEVVTSTVQATCSAYGSITGRQFTISLVENPGKITITRKL